MTSFNYFRQTISSEEELQELLGGKPSQLASNKVITQLDQHCRDFIAKSPFLFLSTSNREGLCDASPRGDAPGFVMVLDDKTILIPERPGNRRVDSMRNILSNPHVGLLFLIPGLEETLRINGRACLVQDQDLLEQMQVKGRTPLLGIGVEVEECFVHCAKAFKRSGLWQSESWLEPQELPSVPKMLADHVKLPGMTGESVAELLEESYTKRLY
ncbi:pyridoxamine 5'-phosphate oxidase family protein [Brevibacillus dissolubilis]|uniref:pyridoxamine 5'-phosphate oxidase family protein n=1 Tax=Brevibacillus dissolubilis TaxID=1844116 RepID=UPI00111736F7|nr:pyridoxamine 5'-phosphate oxidase family protein [Brevibacillus dissolubilis]